LNIINARIPDEIKNDERRYYEMVKYIGISWLNTYMYCPYQLYLWRVKKIKVPKTAEMTAGTERHEILQLNHEASVEEELSIEDALISSKLERKAYRFREVHVLAKLGRYQIAGYIDELIIYPERVDIIDDKPGKNAYMGEKMQVYGYALAFREMHGIHRKIRAIIRNRDSGEILFTEYFGGENEKLLQNTLYDVYLLLKDLKHDFPAPNPAKCARCRYREVCEHYQKFNSNRKIYNA